MIEKYANEGALIKLKNKGYQFVIPKLKIFLNTIVINICNIKKGF